MNKIHPSIIAFILVAVIVICSTVLGTLGDTTPDWFKDLAFVLVGVGGGVAVPTLTVNRTRPPAPVSKLDIPS